MIIRIPVIGAKADPLFDRCQAESPCHAQQKTAGQCQCLLRHRPVSLCKTPDSIHYLFHHSASCFRIFPVLTPKDFPSYVLRVLKPPDIAICPHYSAIFCSLQFSFVYRSRFLFRLIFIFYNCTGRGFSFSCKAEDHAGQKGSSFYTVPAFSLCMHSKKRRNPPGSPGILPHASIGNFTEFFLCRTYHTCYTISINPKSEIPEGGIVL